MDGENIKRPALTNGLTEVVINKPDANHTVNVKADLVLRSRRQSHDIVDEISRNTDLEVINIPLGDIKDGVFSA